MNFLRVEVAGSCEPIIINVEHITWLETAAKEVTFYGTASLRLTETSFNKLMDHIIQLYGVTE